MNVMRRGSTASGWSGTMRVLIAAAVAGLAAGCASTRPVADEAAWVDAVAETRMVDATPQQVISAATRVARDLGLRNRGGQLFGGEGGEATGSADQLEGSLHAVTSSGTDIHVTAVLTGPGQTRFTVSGGPSAYARRTIATQIASGLK